MKRKIIFSILVLISFTGVQDAQANDFYLNYFHIAYPNAAGTRIDNCALCHIDLIDHLRNPYGTDFQLQPSRDPQAFFNIQNFDSDGDGFTNVVEIHNLTFPGNANDFPLVTQPQIFNISGFKINSDTGMGIPGWTIILTNSTMTVPATTNNDGMYQFTGLLNGTYTVTETGKPGWKNVTPASIEVIIAGAEAMNRNFTNIPISTIIPAIADVKPDTLNIGSRSDMNALTVYIEILGYNVSEINVSTVILNTSRGTVRAQLSPFEVGDNDKDNVPDLMVKFNRQAVIGIMGVGENIRMDIRGTVSGETFEGTDFIRIINPPYQPGKGDSGNVGVGGKLSRYL